ncbi:hypothetical protein ACO0OE_002210 [Hanseniaspora uvarum]
MSSLRDQLSQIATQTQGIALDRKRRQKIHSASLIYIPKVAAAQDFEFIYDQIYDHYLELCSIDSRFDAFKNSLFAESSITLDRNTLNDDENKDLNTNINMFLLMVSSKWHLNSTLYAVEWLVRRFQIQIHNVEFFLFCSIHHYQTAVFSKILSISKLPNNYSVTLGPFQKPDSMPPNSSSLLKLFHDFEIRSNYFKFMSRLIKHKLGSQSVYTFISVLAINLVATYPNILSDLIPSVLEISAKLLACKDSSFKEAQTAAHTMLLVLSKTDLNETIIFAAVETILTNIRDNSNTQKTGFITICSLLQSLNGEVKQLSPRIFKLLNEKYGKTLVYNIGIQELSVNKFVVSYIRSAIRYDYQDGLSAVIEINQFWLQSFTYLVKADELLVIESLIALNISPEIFEIRLTTSLFKESEEMDSNNAEKVLKEISDSKIVGSMTTIEPYKEWESKHSQHVFNENISVLSIDTARFNKLLSFFVEALGRKYSTKQFLEFFFTNFESRITFLIRVLASSTPSALKLVIVENLQRITGSISKTMNLFSLVPSLICALNDKSKSVREAIIRYLRSQVLKRCTNDTFFMIDSIYGKDVEISLFEPKQCDKWLKNFLDNYNVDIDSFYDFCINKKSESIDMIFWADQANKSKLYSCKNTFINIITSSKFYNSNYSELLSSNLKSFIDNYDDIKAQCVEEKLNFSSFETTMCSIVCKGEKNESNINFITSSLNSQYKSLSEVVILRLYKIFITLKFNTEINILNRIIDATAKTPELLNYDSLEVLQTLNIDCDVYSAILNSSNIIMEESEEAQQQHLLKKRRRRSSASVKSVLQKDEVTQLAEYHLKKITIIIESIDGSRNLKNVNEQFLAAMFNHLNDLETLDNDGGLPILYVQEILCNCLLKSINILKEQQQNQKSKTKLHTLRPDILVAAIRSSPSPQVQNKLLMVISALASLSPEIILHSIMPIFTFMGTHSIRQDDEFTNNVVENTIKAVIPALLQNSGNIDSELEVLLSSFVAAFNHVPKHRRVKLFTTLISTLGTANSMHSFLFLIGEQFYNANTSFKIGETKEIITFTKSFINNFAAEEQLSAIHDFLNLINVLPLIINNTAESGELFNKAKKVMLQRSLFSSNILRMNETELINFRKSLLGFLSGIIAESDDTYYTAGSLKLRIMSSILEGKSEIKQLVSTTTKTILQMINDIDSHITSFKNSKSTRVNKKLLKTKRQSGSSTSSSKSGSEDNEYTKQEILTDIKGLQFEILSDVLALLTIQDYTDAVIPLMCNEQDDQIRYHMTLKISKRFSYEPVGETVDIMKQVVDVLFANLMDNSSSNEIIYVSLNALSYAINKYKETLADELLKALEISVNKLNDEFNENVVISSLSVINICIQLLGIKSIQYYSKTVPKALALSNDLQNDKLHLKNKLVKEELQLSILLLFATVLKKIPMFASSNLQDILLSIMYAFNVKEEIRLNIINLLLENCDLKEVLNKLHKLWQSGIFTVRNEKPNGVQSMALSIYLSTLEKTINLMDKKTCKIQSAVFFKLLTHLFEFRSYSSFDNNTINKIESMVHVIAHAFILKINDQLFRPLFAYLVKWAFLGENVNNKEMTRNERLVQFFKLFNKLQEQLRSILTSYFTYILDDTNQILVDMTEKYDVTNVNLRRLVIVCFGLSFKYDKDEYWRSSSRFEMVCPTIISQLKNIEPPLGKFLAKTIGALAQCNSMADEHNKMMQKEIIKHMKPSCRSNEKLWAIRSIKLIYAKVGESWLVLLPQLVPIVAELLEDDDETIESEVRTGLVKVFENVLGEPFDKYLD